MVASEALVAACTGTAEKSAARTIVIVGAGFCGTLVAINLLQKRFKQRTRIVIIERSDAVGRGIAYADRGQSYLLNVPAARMSANSAAPLEFLRFARRHVPDARSADFLPRSLYGEYLQSKLAAARK